MKEIKYLERVPFIININQAIIKNVKHLHSVYALEFGTYRVFNFKINNL